MRTRLSILLACFLLAFHAPVLRAEDKISEPTSPAAPDAAGVTLAAPSETEKGPAAVKSSAKPQFTLPEVVITGDNQLTIGAKRLERHEDDVTRGSKELRGLSRSENDLPGLERQRTGLSALSPDAARDLAAILHGGVGTQGAWEGWGLVGGGLKGFQALLSAHGEMVKAAKVLDREARRRAVGWGAVFQGDPTEGILLRLSRGYEGERWDLPYQGDEDKRRWSVTEGDALVRLTSAWKAEFRACYRDTWVEPGSIEPSGYHTVERDGAARVQWEAREPWLDSLWAEGGGRVADGGFSEPALRHLDAAWTRAGARFQVGTRAGLEVSFGATRLGGVSAKTKGEPSLELEFLPDAATRVLLHGRAARLLPFFQTTQGIAPATVPSSGLPSPVFIRREAGLDLERRLDTRWTVSLGAKGWEEEGRSQWTEGGTILHRPLWTTMGRLRCWEIRSGLRAGLGGVYGFALEGRLSGAEDLSSIPRVATAWPRAQAQARLYRKTPKDTLTFTVRGVGRREANEGGGTTLSPYWTLGAEARRRLTDRLTVWVLGENLNGQSYEQLPGYGEPRFLARVGLEVIF